MQLQKLHNLRPICTAKRTQTQILEKKYQRGYIGRKKLKKQQKLYNINGGTQEIILHSTKSIKIYFINGGTQEITNLSEVLKIMLY